MKILSIVGARPQFVKASVVSQKIRTNHTEIFVHTGQHYDHGLSTVFFEKLNLPEPDYHLGVGSASHTRQTAEMMLGLEKILKDEDPDAVLVYGDTNSTLAGALTAAKMRHPIVHIEAGVRSHNWEMPEEINRVITDHASDVLCAPSSNGTQNLINESVHGEIYDTGDVMLDAVLSVKGDLPKTDTVLSELGLSPLESGQFILCTIHRARNTDNGDRLAAIIDALANTPYPVILPIHPRTKKALKKNDLLSEATQNIHVVEPVGYIRFLSLIDGAERVVTDSGGVQKETFFLDTFCITLREETEWIETVNSGWNRLVGSDSTLIHEALHEEWDPPEPKPTPYGKGNAASEITDSIEDAFGGR